MSIAVETIQDGHEDRARREAQASGSADICFICGRGLTEKALDSAWFVHLADGGAVIVQSDAEVDEDGDMGWFPVGSGCAGKVPDPYRSRI